MIGWLRRCFSGSQVLDKGALPIAQNDAAEETQRPEQWNGTEQRVTSVRNVAFTSDGSRQDETLTPVEEQLADAEQGDSPGVSSLEEARQVIFKLKTRLRELESSNAPESLLQSTALLRPGEAMALASGSGTGRRGSEQLGFSKQTEGDKQADRGEEQRSEQHAFRTYNKQELVELLRSCSKPAAAVLLQAVCEEDLASLPQALLLDVDPALGDAVAGAPEVVAALQNARAMGLSDPGQLAVADYLPGYLRLRLYMMQAWAARPMLAHANTAARTLFEVRADRQLQMVLEAQVQQDAMLAMLLQELLDEILAAPVVRGVEANQRLSPRPQTLNHLNHRFNHQLSHLGQRHSPHSPLAMRQWSSMTDGFDAGGGVLLLHSLTHFVNTSNPKVFPFVPVSMRGCGYRKTSGEVVPCVVLEFSPDSNQGAFLEHLQRDYTMMGRMSSIITLFTLKGDVLHQNAGSIAYYGYQRSRVGVRTSNGKRNGQGAAAAGGLSNGGNDRVVKRPGHLLAAGLELDPAANIKCDERPVLNQLFQLAQSDMLEGMLEAMVQGGMWKCILPVPSSLAPGSRPAAAPSAADLSSSMAPHGAFTPDPESMFTADVNVYTANANAALFGGDRSICNHNDALEGSFNLDRAGGGAAASLRATAALGFGPRALKAVPEQSQELERMSLPNKSISNLALGGEISSLLIPTPLRERSGTKAAAVGGRTQWQRQRQDGAGGEAEEEPEAQVPLPTLVNGGGGGLDGSGAKPFRSGMQGLPPGSGSTRLHTPIAAAAAAGGGPPSAGRAYRRSTTSNIPSSSGATAVAHSSGCATAVGSATAPLGPAASFTSTVGGGGAGSSTTLLRMRRRSGLPLGLDPHPGDALSQSTWGYMLGSNAYESRNSIRDPGGDADPAADTPATSGRRPNLTLESGGLSNHLTGASGGGGGGRSGAAHAVRAPHVSTGCQSLEASIGAAAGAMRSTTGRSDATANSRPSLLLQPSQASQPDTSQHAHPAWQFRHSMWQDALQSQPSRSLCLSQSQSQLAFQSQASGTALASGQPPPLAPPPTTTATMTTAAAAGGYPLGASPWVLAPGHGLLSSIAGGENPAGSGFPAGGPGRSAAGLARAAADAAGAGSGVPVRQRSGLGTEQAGAPFGIAPGVRHQITSPAVGGRSPSHSTSSFISPQASIHQHPDLQLLTANMTNMTNVTNMTSANTTNTGTGIASSSNVSEGSRLRITVSPAVRPAMHMQEPGQMQVASPGGSPVVVPAPSVPSAASQPQVQAPPPQQQHHHQRPSGHGHFLLRTGSTVGNVAAASQPHSALQQYLGAMGVAVGPAVSPVSPPGTLPSAFSGIVPTLPGSNPGGGGDLASNGGGGSAANAAVIIGLPSNGGGGGSRSRRAPMRQSERSNPNLQSMGALSGASNAAPAGGGGGVGIGVGGVGGGGGGGGGARGVKSAMSFSHSARVNNHRPLVRMMSFLNAGPLVQQPAGGVVRPAIIRTSSGQQHGGSNVGGPLEVAVRPGSAKVLYRADSGQCGLLSAAAARFPAIVTAAPGSIPSASMGYRRPSLRHMTGTVGTRPGSEVDESSCMALAVREASADAVHSTPQQWAAPLDGDGGRTYHEVTATPFLDPVSKSQVVMVVQTDVTARVRLERRLAEVMEAEHKLLENIFPRHVLEHIAHTAANTSSGTSQFNLSMLNAMPDPTKTATDHDQVTILFADIVGFTGMCKEVPAKRVMKFLNDLYTRFDTLLDIYGVYKVETIGDCYMVAGGLISKDADGFAAVRKGSCDNLQAWRVLSFAKAMLRDARKVLLPTTQEPVKMRVGIHTGPVVSGIVGTRMPRFCLFGDTINTASRMESTCPHGRIQVSAATHALIPDEDWEPTGGVEVKGKGRMETYLLKHPPGQLIPTGLASASLSVPGIPELAPGLATHGHGYGHMHAHGFTHSSGFVPAQSAAAAAAAAISGAAGGNVRLGLPHRLATGAPLGGGGGVAAGSTISAGAASDANNYSGSVGITVSVSVGQSMAVTAGGAGAGAGGPGGGSTGAGRDGRREGGSQARRGSSSGQNPSFLFNTVW